MNAGYVIAIILAIVIGLADPMLFVPALVLFCILAAINNATAG